ncbi:phage terminase, large subunit [Streptococcus pneumoniae]|nr:phage terminase, large subunit [Streptococcus pneumoniae]VTG43745.1 phage terminase, large subunit [Streptococcus pneumoniae]
MTVKDFNKDELLQDSANKLCIGLDFGFTHDPTALCCSLINDTTKEIYVFDEAYKVGLITKEVAKMIKDKGYHRSQIIADSAELRLIEELRSEHGISRIKESRKGKDSIMAGVSKLQGYAIYVHPDCKNIMDEFYSYCYQRDKEGNWLNKPEDKNNHLMDALRYSLQCIEGGKATVRRRSDYGL